MDGLYDIVWSDTGNTFNATSKYMSGTLKALLDTRDGNNEENFKGTVDYLYGTKLVITNTTQNSVEKMTMAEEGVITIDNKKFEYSSFTVDYDAAGNATYTFALKEPAGDGADLLAGHQAQIGTSIDAMGVPYYQAQMNEFLRAFCMKFNDIEMQGQDLNGDPMKAFFVARDLVTGEQEDLNKSDTYTQITSAMSSYYKLTAGSFEVAKASVKDPNIFSTTADIVNGPDKAEILELLKPLKEQEKLYRGSGANGFLQCMFCLLYTSQCV